MACIASTRRRSALGITWITLARARAEDSAAPAIGLCGDDGSLSRTRGVIVWGSTQASAAGYPHNVNISIGLPCQPCFREDPKLSRMPRGPCVTPPGQTYDAPRHACLHGLPVERVLSEVRCAWDAASRQPQTVAVATSR